MPYPESCPECGSQFRNTGTHYTARRNEVGRHVLLELGCQNTSRRYWWDFTAGQLAEDERPAATLAAAGVRSAAATNGSGESNGHFVLPTLTLADAAPPLEPEPEPMSSTIDPDLPSTTNPEPAAEPVEAPPVIEHLPLARPVGAPDALKEAFVRQLQLDRLTLRQMRALLMSEEARRAIEVAVGATEATYERLALILFGTDLPQLLGKPIVPPAPPTMTAEERLELQREKARIRARLRRAAIKAAKLG
jgi:hypothetical protein